MKLLIIFTSRNDEKKLTEHLREQNLTVTVIGSEGGFLRRQNSTLLVALPDTRLTDALAVIKKTCPARTEQVDTSFAAGGVENVGLPKSAEIPIGGATVLVLSIEKLIKT